MSSLLAPKKIGTRRLHGTEMKQLVRLLLNFPTHSNDLSAYQKSVKQGIKALPRRLRHTHFSDTGDLCVVHKGLDAHLMREICSWVKHEISSAIGKFVYPLIVSEVLTSSQELRIRQLEPVLQLWREDFQLESSAPPRRQPLARGSKFALQQDKCQACILARIGSDKDVLRALYAGMIARFDVKRLVDGKVGVADLTVAGIDDPNSKRVRFVRYWIKAMDGGDRVLRDAAELGIQLKKLHLEWKACMPTERVSIYSNSVVGTSISSPTSAVNPFRDPPQSSRGPASGDPFRDPESRSRTAVYNSYQQQNQSAPSTRNGDPKLGPSPRPNSIDPHTPLSSLSFSSPTPSSRQVDPQLRTNGTNYTNASARPEPLQINKQRQPPLPNTSSRRIAIEPLYPSSSASASAPASCWSASTATVDSYDGGPSTLMQARVDNYNQMLGARNPYADENLRGMRGSVYSGFGGGEDGDPFGDMDVDLDVDDEEGEEVGLLEEDKVRKSSDVSVNSRWGEIY